MGDALAAPSDVADTAHCDALKQLSHSILSICAVALDLPTGKFATAYQMKNCDHKPKAL